MSNDQQQQQLLPLGFRFYPTEEELLSFYLQNKLSKMREADIERVIPVADIYRLDAWQLPQISGEPCIRDSEQWFFFCPQQRREAGGGRAARTTPSGYWKTTGSPGLVYSSADRSRVLGVKKTMVFYRGRAPTGSKTKWKMNEYRALENVRTMDPAFAPKLQNEFSLCRLYKNSGCMRSFDRRPAMAAAAGENSRARNEVSNNGGNCSGQKRARWQDRSSADDELDGSNPLLQGGDMDLKMLEEFDWDKFDWV